MKKIIFMSLFSFVSLFAKIEEVKWTEANKTCVSQEKRLPSLEELIKLQAILPEGVFWSETQLKESSENFEYWVVQKKADGSYIKGILSQSQATKFKCIKGNRKNNQVLNRSQARETFRAIYKEDVVVFPLGYLSFLGTPKHNIDGSIYPYNFWQFEIKMDNAITNADMNKLVGKTIAYDTILMGKVLSVKQMDEYGYDYMILTTPTDMLSPYILPDEAVR